MQRTLLHAKLHRVHVTHADLNYIGSVTIDQDLLDAADILHNEKILVINLENGTRIETYALPGKAGTGVIGMNGGCARVCQVGDRLLIMSFVSMTTAEARKHEPKVVFVDEHNRVAQVVGAN
jgi:aspartate 1-decarboxylase